METFQENRRKPINWPIVPIFGPKRAQKFSQFLISATTNSFSMICVLQVHCTSNFQDKVLTSSKPGKFIRLNCAKLRVLSTLVVYTGIRTIVLSRSSGV